MPDIDEAAAYANTNGDEPWSYAEGDGQSGYDSWGTAYGDGTVSADGALPEGEGYLPDDVALAGVGGVLRFGWAVLKWTTGLRIAWFIIDRAEADMEDRERQKTRAAQVEGWRQLGDEARYRTLVEGATHVLEGFATSSDSDIIAFSLDSARRVQAVTDSLVQLFRSNDHWIGEDITIDGGFLARMPEDKWNAIESHAETLQNEWFEALRSGEPFNDPLRPTRGPVQVNPDDVSRLFFERVSHPQYVINVRGEPPDEEST
jgi:hypothetical protein